ncbi:DUF5009 domain-containing protein [Undibacterium cyanobacteriorum]|uniref:DUF5009 domain-containing protein n=1 Tax=Undibacterium cyanobacteriorum TaxID=3073561 RepID=A0ABY9RD48_9BURK|nr:DUF5009 domain-containing protein [Undibacterium sp. 20NA77.5]WMW79158.1 DUF5009 domain-containing protein [Undibacterium sp. 20NA77.5]
MNQITQAKPKLRIESIDCFRGLTFFFMIIVNELHGVPGISKWLKHMPAHADAMSLPDVIFPAFLFIVGMSIPFGVQARKKAGDSNLKIVQHIFLRALGLITMGFFMVNAEAGYDEARMPISIGAWALTSYLAFMLIWGVYQFKNQLVNIGGRLLGIFILAALASIYHGDQTQSWMSPQWWGILGLIGWAYLVSALVYLVTGPCLMKIGVALLGMIAYYAASHSAILFSPALNIFLSQDAHAAHSSIVLCGLLTSTLFFYNGSSVSAIVRLSKAMQFSLVLLFFAFALHNAYPISKIYATPTWCMYSAALCVAIYCLLYFQIDMRCQRKLANLVYPVASNPLICYLMPFVVAGILQVFKVSNPIHGLSGFYGAIACVLYSCLIVFLVGRLNQINFKMRF